MEKLSVYKIVTNEIIKRLNEGVIPWRQEWRNGIPVNFTSRRAYSGLNIFMLAMKGFDSPYWLTFNQCKKAGGKVKKGEKSTIVVYWQKFEKEQNKEEQSDNEEKQKAYFLLRYYRVFNVLQCEGLQIKKEETREFLPIGECERIISEYKNKPLILLGGGQPSYSYKEDQIRVPMRGNFDNEASYYATLFHELVHSTGHEKRLNRSELMVKTQFASGNANYSKEELIAEFGASFLCGVAGISPATLENSAAYIQGWIKELENNEKILISAASKGQRAADYILGIKKDARPLEEMKI